MTIVRDRPMMKPMTCYVVRCVFLVRDEFKQCIRVSLECIETSKRKRTAFEQIVVNRYQSLEHFDEYRNHLFTLDLSSCFDNKRCLMFVVSDCIDLFC
jgi:hypothetical protein